jgi:hypothetical protein
MSTTAEDRSTGQVLCTSYSTPQEYRWCPQWWRHAEAITRLTALWQSWEAMRLQPGTGIANWLRDHLDHQLPILLGRSGPFAQCSEEEHIDPRIAAAEPPPFGWWTLHRRRRPQRPNLDADFACASTTDTC